MSRVGYAEPPDGAAGDELLALFRTGRGRVPKIFRVLLFSATVAEGWARLGNALRRSTSLDMRSRELVILLVAHLRRSAYEWDHHAAVAGSVGIEPDEVERIAAWPASAGWSEDDRAVLSFVGASVEGVDVPAWCWDALLARRGQAFVVDLAATAAYYGAVAQLARTLEVESEGSELRDEALHPLGARPVLVADRDQPVDVATAHRVDDAVVVGREARGVVEHEQVQ